MRQFAVIDSETEPFSLELAKKGEIPQPFIWGYYDGDEYLQFTDTKELVDFLQFRDIIIYAHNGGKFDYHYLINHFQPFTQLMIINGRLSKFKIGKAEFRDSYNILPVPLAAYKKDVIDYKIFKKETRYKPENWKKIIKYLKSDCIYLYELIEHFRNEHGSQLTLASAAMNTWRKKFSDGQKHNTNLSFYDKFKPFYYGGRVQCFQKGIINKKFNVYDINSAYPFAMTHEHPHGAVFTVSKKLSSDIKKIQKSFIKLKAKSYGAFPKIEIVNNIPRLAFPSDNEIKEFTITGWEYLAGLETNTIEVIKILEVYEFYNTTSFTDYVNYYFSLKSLSEKNSPDYILSKLMLNALYGKFAANPSKYKEDMIIPPEYIYSAEENGWEYASEIGNYFLIEKPLDESKHTYYNVATAASITGFVRAHLWKAINSSINVLYCDTDSIACEKADVPMSDKLGDWELEASCIKGGIGGKKLYAFQKEDKKWKTASKGAKLTHNQIMKVCKGETITYKNEIPTYSIKMGISYIDKQIKMT